MRLVWALGLEDGILGPRIRSWGFRLKIGALGPNSEVLEPEVEVLKPEAVA